MNTETLVTDNAFISASSADLRDWIMVELDNLKGLKPVAMDVSKLPTIAEHLVVASGTSLRHLRSMAENLVITLKSRGIRPLSVQTDLGPEWVLVDFGSVVVHLMHPKARDFYALEDLWDPKPALAHA